MRDPDGAARLRVGQGFDVHRFSDDPTRPLVLGGIKLSEGPGLMGHSDADALCHALSDALLGAAGLGDLGRHFPETDERFAGADSAVLLEQVVAMLAEDGWRPVNADCTVVCDTPRMAGHTEAMGKRLSGILGSPVNVKATRAEGLGALGRAEGLACLAVALVEGPSGPSGQ